MSTDQHLVQELADRQACMDLLSRYACALEWVDEEALQSVFYPDADVDYGYFKGSGEEFVPLIIGLVGSYTRTWHNNGAPLLKLEGDVAEAETHGTGGTVNTVDGKTTTTLLGGRYLDRLEKRDGRWGIAKRVYIVDWQHAFESDAEAEAATGLNILSNPSIKHALYRRL